MSVAAPRYGALEVDDVSSEAAASSTDGGVPMRRWKSGAVRAAVASAVALTIATTAVVAQRSASSNAMPSPHPMRAGDYEAEQSSAEQLSVAAAAPAADAEQLHAMEPINNGEDAGPSGPVVTWSGYTCDYDMRLACQVTFGLDRGVLGTKRLKVSMSYAPADEPGFRLFTAPAYFDASSSEWTMDVFRLRPSTLYTAEVVGELTEDVGTTSGKGAFRLATGNFTSRTTGYSAFDEGPVATVGGSAPSYGVLFFDLEFVSKEFRGLVAVDSAGYVVWYHNRKASVQAFDQFPNYEIVIQASNDLAKDGWSEMAVISAFGTENAASQTECHGDYHNYTQVTHEARARRERGDVLTVVSRITRLNHTAFLGQNPVEYLYEERIGAWRPTDGVVTEMYGVLDYFDPIQNPVAAPNSYQYREAQCAHDSAGENITVLDWSHVSSITESIKDEYYVMSISNLDTIAAFDVGGSGLQWAFSSSNDMRNDFNFSSERDKFYNPVGAYVIEDKQTVGNESRFLELLVFDGGLNRPGCMGNYTGCYSRAIEYLLDLDKFTATVTWEFEFPLPNTDMPKAIARHKDLFVRSGGSVIRMADDDSEEHRYFVGYTGTSDSQEATSRKYAYMFEADGKGTVVSEVKVARQYWDLVESGLYRAIPSKSLYGETKDSPFRMRGNLTLTDSGPAAPPRNGSGDADGGQAASETANTYDPAQPGGTKTLKFERDARFVKQLS